MEEFRNKYPEWCVIRESETSSTCSSTDGLPNLRLCSSGSSQGGGRGRPCSLGSRSASDSEEDRPDSSTTLAGVDGVGPPAFGSGFSLGLSVGLRLGLESEPLPPLMLDNVDVDSMAPSAINGGGSNNIAVGGPDTSDPFSDPGFPVEILPFLFLGNAQNSRDCDALDKHCIRVRSHLPLHLFFFKFKLINN